MEKKSKRNLRKIQKFGGIERQFQLWIKNKGILHIPGGKLEVINTEVPLIDPIGILSQEDAYKLIAKRRFGFFDLLIRFRQINYVCEIKFYPYNSGEFWDALKCVGYCAYYNWQRELERQVARPAIFMPFNKLRLENKIIANRLKITIFGIEKLKNDWKISIIHDPYN